jgi:LysM repeat protein
MWGISAQLGTTVHQLAAANGIDNPDVIAAGQRIYY